MPSRSHIDIAVAAFLIMIGAVGLYGSSIIEKTGLEPVGAAPVPRWISVSIIVMALAMLVLALRRRPDDAQPAQPSYQPRPRLAIAAVALLALYILTMQLGLLGFRGASILYIAAFGVLMSGLQWRAAAFHAAIAIAVALGGYTLFTDFLFIDLPN